MKKKKTSSILRKFLLFNLSIFSVLGLFTVLYLNAIQPNLVKKVSTSHFIIINNTSDHIERLGVDFNKEGIKQFLLSTRFLFQGLDRVQFFSKNAELVGDTNILDLDPSVFEKSDEVIEEGVEKKQTKIEPFLEEGFKESSISNIIQKKYKDQPITIENEINNSFFVSTISELKIKDSSVGYIVVTNEANDILIAVAERKNFIIRTVLAIALVILIFSMFLNKYILKPIGFLVSFTEAIKNKSDQNIDIQKFFVREDEVGKLTKSIDEMTKELQKRTKRAETFSTDLAHEIRNPLASLKGASELLDKTDNQKDRNKLFEIINHDVERIERLITDYSQMLKDEVAITKEQMSKIDLKEIVNSVVDDFNSIYSPKRGIKISLELNDKYKKYEIYGIENRIEQILANLLENSISFSKDNQEITVKLNKNNNNITLDVIDQGIGFKEKDTNKIFNRFYSNRPEKFGEHSGLGLNIVKNLIDLHGGKIIAGNNLNKKGAKIEIIFPNA